MTTLSINRTWIHRAAAGTVAGALLAAAVVAPAAANAAAPALNAPGGLKVARNAADLNQLDITWKPVAGADRYTVNVFDGTRDRAFNVAASRTSLTVAVSGVCAQYNVTVTAHDDNGSSAKTNVFRVDRLAPGGISGLSASRTATTAQLAWRPPTTGAAPVQGYQVSVKQLSNGRVLADRRSADATESLSGLDPARQYVAQITPFNRYGSCFSSKVVLQGDTPSAPRALKAVRAADNPDRLQMTWTAPEWSGFGKIDHYEIGYRSPTMPRPKWLSVGQALSGGITLDSKSTWSLWVRAVSSSGKASLSKELRMEKVGGALTPEVDPKVTIAETDGVLTVDFDGVVGSSARYPTMTVAVAPTLGGRGFRESHSVSNRAGQVVFDRVPCGVFSVVVTGQGPTDTREFARQVLNRCDTGAIPADRWKLVYGKADVKGNDVNMRYGNEARVMSTMKRTSQDMVFTTTATLRSGWGYGIWTRASVPTGAAATGYSFQYDPGYENVNKAYGKALLLRVWNQGRECGTPVAKVKWPAGLSVNGAHDITVVAQGDTLYASINGIKLFDVTSLKESLTTSGCRAAGFSEPTGTEVGFRTWSSDGSAVFSGTTLN